MPDYDFLVYEPLDDGQIVRIMLNRPDARNAQNRGLLVELNDAFLTAEEAGLQVCNDVAGNQYATLAGADRNAPRWISGCRRTRCCCGSPSCSPSICRPRS